MYVSANHRLSRPASPYLPTHLQTKRQVKEKLGLDQVRYCATGAAPLSDEIQEYFASVGVTIFEVGR